MITYEKLFWNILFSEKSRISRAIPWKCLSFRGMSKAQNPSKIAKNNSQGIIFVTILCQRVQVTITITRTTPLRIIYVMPVGTKLSHTVFYFISFWGTLQHNFAGGINCCNVMIGAVLSWKQRIFGLQSQFYSLCCVGINYCNVLPFLYRICFFQNISSSPRCGSGPKYHWRPSPPPPLAP